MLLRGILLDLLLGLLEELVELAHLPLGRGELVDGVLGLDHRELLLARLDDVHLELRRGLLCVVVRAEDQAQLRVDLLLLRLLPVPALLHLRLHVALERGKVRVVLRLLALERVLEQLGIRDARLGRGWERVAQLGRVVRSDLDLRSNGASLGDVLVFRLKGLLEQRGIGHGRLGFLCPPFLTRLLRLDRSLGLGLGRTVASEVSVLRSESSFEELRSCVGHQLHASVLQRVHIHQDGSDGEERQGGDAKDMSSTRSTARWC
mmetsp:Transcript_12241/g.29230  ORF Transcript_12241/g.29230 Transcript_12241/m.29230 type:complete len:262 (+) Transcript_12241:541-1326(+)